MLITFGKTRLTVVSVGIITLGVTLAVCLFKLGELSNVLDSRVLIVAIVLVIDDSSLLILVEKPETSNP